jgi:hypothetical protein
MINDKTENPPGRLAPELQLDQFTAQILAHRPDKLQQTANQG